MTRKISLLATFGRFQGLFRNNNRALLSLIFLGNTLWQADLRNESGLSFLGSVLHTDIYSDPHIKFIGFNLLQQVIPV